MQTQIDRSAFFAPGFRSTTDRERRVCPIPPFTSRSRSPPSPRSIHPYVYQTRGCRYEMAPASTRASINTNYTTGRRRPLVLVLLLALVLGALHSAAAGTASSSAAAAGPAAAGGSQRRPRFLSAHARARSPPLAMASGANPIAALKSLAAAYGNWLVRPHTLPQPAGCMSSACVPQLTDPLTTPRAQPHKTKPVSRAPEGQRHQRDRHGGGRRRHLAVLGNGREDGPQARLLPPGARAPPHSQRRYVTCG